MRAACVCPVLGFQKLLQSGSSSWEARLLLFGLFSVMEETMQKAALRTAGPLSSVPSPQVAGDTARRFRLQPRLLQASVPTWLGGASLTEGAVIGPRSGL